MDPSDITNGTGDSPSPGPHHEISLETPRVNLPTSENYAACVQRSSPDESMMDPSDVINGTGASPSPGHHREPSLESPRVKLPSRENYAGPVESDTTARGRTQNRGRRNGPSIDLLLDDLYRELSNWGRCETNLTTGVARVNGLCRKSSRPEEFQDSIKERMVWVNESVNQIRDVRLRFKELVSALNTKRPLLRQVEEEVNERPAELESAVHDS